MFAQPTPDRACEPCMSGTNDMYFQLGYMCNFWQVGDTEFDRLMSYDDKCFIRAGSAWRREFMSRWVKIPGGRAMMAVNQQGDVAGYGCRRPAVSVAESHLIGPLYADSYEIAWDLVQQLTRDVIGHNIEMNTT